ncbi:MAG TPA: DUF4097 family beta strand repeat-containing protein [Candidatus Dormibacteraeota bacterium]|jgi:DUF4097 and DUF4098 domain-containing protein YvlB|nr:DUF4097 family beta strand repeat-containing protein [Candidatus Dormibacteraeota bacterium]
MRSRTIYLSALFTASAALAACGFGPAEQGSFDRTLTVSGPTRLELATGSGSVKINGSADGKVHIHGDVSAASFFGNAKDELKHVLDNPPIEQRSSLIRIGKDMGSFRNTSISYTIEVPQETELSISAASGSQEIQNVRGPVTVDSASGDVRVENVERPVQIKSASGSIHVRNLGDDARMTAASGSIEANTVKGDIRARALSGSINIKAPGARVEADTASGSVTVAGANNDVKANTASGGINVQGNPAGNSYWHLKTASGSVEVSVPKDAGFNLSAEAISGQIRADLPIVIEDQGKHSLRAHVGTPGGRVEVRTASGGIRIQPSS